MTSQKDAVLAYLAEGRTITPLKAQAEFGVWRLADVIYKLKREGYKIKTVLKTTTNQKRYAEYSLVK